MADVFLKVLNMSISASWIVLTVLVLRFLLKRAPKWFHCMLWGIVGLRLILPFSIESVFSLIPSAETISKMPDSPRPHFELGITILDNQVNDYLKGTYFEGVSRPMGNFIDITTILSFVWLIGIFVLCIYTMFRYLQLKHKIATAVILRENIYQSENVASPFVLGVLKPKIYLPFHLSEQDMTYVIAHEEAHIRRKDHWWKPLGFLLLTLHWFNPLIWLGYVLLCRDIELACDEKVVKEMNTAQKADYAQALLTCSVNRRIISACPLAFGESDVKNRVQAIFNYKKPSFWVVLFAGVISIVALFCFLTNPINSSDKVLNKLTNSREDKLISQDMQKITLSIPVSALPDAIFTEETNFNESDIVAYEDTTTTIYLKKAQPANEGPDYLYFCFDFEFHLPKDQGSLLYPYKIADNGFESGVATADGILKTDVSVFEKAVDDRGQGPNEQIWFYVSTEAVRQAKDTISFDIYLNQIAYSFDGIHTSNRILQEPPKLMVLWNETSVEFIEALKSTYSWTYRDGIGMSTAIMTDGNHPTALIESLQVLELEPAASLDSLYAVLQFRGLSDEVIPDEIIVHAYAVENLETEETIEVIIENGAIFVPLKDGDYVYEVVATWNGSEKYNGTVHYGFRAVKTD